MKYCTLADIEAASAGTHPDPQSVFHAVLRELGELKASEQGQPVVPAQVANTRSPTPTGQEAGAAAVRAFLESKLPRPAQLTENEIIACFAQTSAPDVGEYLVAVGRKIEALVRLGTGLDKINCWCETCRPRTLGDMRMVLCPDCGNKRCPKAHNHENACTNSNDVGQKGSSWEHVKPFAPSKAEVVTEAPPEPLACHPHPKAPHGFLRDASHSLGRYVCECENWDPYEAGYQDGLQAGLEQALSD